MTVQELKQRLIKYQDEMRAMHGPEYPSWREEAKEEIKFLKNILRSNNLKNKNIIYEEQLRMLEAVLMD